MDGTQQLTFRWKTRLSFRRKSTYAFNNPYRFTDPDGREVLDSAEEARKRYGQGTQGKGHHWVPFGSTTKTDISPEARKVFGQSVSGEKLPNEDHLPGHSKYTDAVRKELDSYAKENKIDLSKMTANQARDFVEHVKGSVKPDISNLNSRVMNFTERLRGMKPAAKAIFRTLAAWGVVDYAESNISINTPACRADPGCNELRAK